MCSTMLRRIVVGLCYYEGQRFAVRCVYPPRIVSDEEPE